MVFKPTNRERSQVVVCIELHKTESGTLPTLDMEAQCPPGGKVDTSSQTLVTDDTNTGVSQSPFSGIHYVHSEES